MQGKMKLLALVLLAAAALATLTAAPAGAAFGLKNLSVSFEEEDGSPAIEVGGHPFALITEFETETTEDPLFGVVPDEAMRNLRIELPAGMVGDPGAVPLCASADFGHLVKQLPSCSAASAVGVAEVSVTKGIGNKPATLIAGVYNISPPPGAVAKIGFVVLGVPVTADLKVNPDPPHNVVAELTNVSQAVNFFASRVVIWGNPASSAHDSERGLCVGPGESTCPVELPERPFLTLPRSCSGPLVSRFKASSWQHPNSSVSYSVQSPPGMSGCLNRTFTADVSALLTSREADSPSGLAFNLDIEDPGLTSVNGTAQSDIRKAVVTLPEGVTVNPAVAAGLAACSEADLARESASSVPGEGCPQASKLGEVEVETPLLAGEVLNGSVFAATQDANPFNSMLAIYMVIQDPELGISVKLPGRIDLDAKSGRITTTFGESPNEIPQFPFSHLRFRFRGGERGPLVTPPACGSHDLTATFTPWGNPDSPYTLTAPLTVDAGPGGGPCPSGLAPFAPGFSAGTLSNAAGSYSPLGLRLTRNAGEQNLTRFDAILPPGLTAKLAGVERCSDAAIVAARTRDGRAEAASPSCPDSSRIGSTLGGAGAGDALVYVPGSLYLAGPYNGHPLSVVAITPALAGPFDAGTVVVRESLDVNPLTAEVRAEGGTSDSIPSILRGIPLTLRDLRISVDRPGFTRNPTSCSEKSSQANVFGSGADLLSPGDDIAVSRSDFFQAASCASLSFKPRLSLRLKGGTRRSAYPALEAIVRPREGDANIKRAVVTLPESSFLAQEHINTICTRVQFAARTCPKGSIYGYAIARTPLLDEPLQGPVYLRSSNHPLPDLVVDLQGLFNIELVGRIDSVRRRIRSSFEAVPDQPVSSFTLKMKGGKKGLIVNSRNLCVSPPHGRAELAAQNGRARTLNLAIEVDGCKRKKGKRRG